MGPIYRKIAFEAPDIRVVKWKNMLHMVTWREYWTLVGIGSLLWYAWIGYRFLPGMRRQGGLLEPIAKGGPGLRNRRERRVARTEGKTSKMDEGRKAPVAGQRKEEAKGLERAERKNGVQVTGTGMPPRTEIGNDGMESGPTNQDAVPVDGTKVGGRQLAGGAQLELPLSTYLDPRVLATNVTRELKVLIEEVGKKMAREELLYKIRLVLDRKEFKVLRGGYLQLAINEEIRSALANYCSIHLEAEELRGLWIR